MASSSKREKAPGKAATDRREKAARAKEVGACSSNGAREGSGSPPQCRKEKHQINTRNMV